MYANTIYRFGLTDDHTWQESIFINPSHAKQKENLLCPGSEQMVVLAALTIKEVQLTFTCTNWVNVLSYVCI